MLDQRSGLIQQLRQWLSGRDIESHNPIIVGMSGGLDSTMLAEALHRLGQTVQIAHVNYGLRGEESDGDESFVRDWAAHRSLPVHVFHAPAAEIKDPRNTESDGTGVQAWARTIRYTWFEELRKAAETAHGRNAFIATAHHADDQAETVLLNLIRSTDPHALAGMRDVSRNGTLIRPLLSFRRETLENQAEQWGVSYRTDSSNSKPDYTRNRIRHEMIPLLESIRSGTTEHLSRWAKRFQPWTEVNREMLEEAINTCTSLGDEGQVVLHLERWSAHPLRLEIMHALAAKFQISARAVPEIERLSEPSVESKAKFESSQARVTREKNTLVWSTQNVAS